MASAFLLLLLGLLLCPKVLDEHAPSLHEFLGLKKLSQPARGLIGVFGAAAAGLNVGWLLFSSPHSASRFMSAVLVISALLVSGFLLGYEAIIICILSKPAQAEAATLRARLTPYQQYIGLACIFLSVVDACLTVLR